MTALAIVALATAVGAEWLGVSLGRRIALRFDVLAQPNPIVRGHQVAVPYLGGTGVFIVYVPLLVAAGVVAGSDRLLLVRVLGALVMLIIGTTDDVRPLPITTRVIAQAVVCTAIVAALDGTPVIERAALVFVAVAIVNAYNLVDVMDGLLCVVAAVGAVGLLGAGLPATDVAGVVLLIGGMAALFAFNSPPARVYAGDAGALTVGFLMASWIVGLIAQRGVGFALPLAGTVAIPLLELVLVVTARLRAGRSPFRGSRDHFSLRLQDRLGWSRWRVLGWVVPAAMLFASGPFAWRFGVPVRATWTCAAAACIAVSWSVCWRYAPQTT